MSKFNVVWVFMLWGSSQLMAKEILPYATFGFRLGWDFQCGMSISPRISVGVTDFDRGVFINFTSGMRKFKRPIIDYSEFSYFDIQAGAVWKELPGIFFGGGVGFLVGSSPEDFKLIPRSTVFTGFLLFPSIDLTFWSKSKISYDAGLEAVLPIPLGGIDFGSIGGE